MLLRNEKIELREINGHTPRSTTPVLEGPANSPNPQGAIIIKK